MQKTYQGKTVTIVHAATAADQGFDAAKPASSVIRLPDGTTRLVQNTELS
jgi:hypothetical protein